MELYSTRGMTVYPPFLTNIIVQIYESKLLSNYANVHRLQLQLINSFMRYKASIKLALLIHHDTLNHDNSKKLLKRLRVSSVSDWLEFAKFDLQEVRVADSVSELLSILQTLQSGWLHADAHANEIEFLHKNCSKVIKGFESVQSSIDLINLILEINNQNSINENRLSLPKLKLTTSILDSIIDILFKEFDGIFDYVLCSLQSFIKSDRKIDYFFRAHQGNNIIPFVQSSQVEIRIGSVFLSKYSITSKVEPSFDLILELSPIVVQAVSENSNGYTSSLSFFNKHLGVKIEYIDLLDNKIHEDERFVDQLTFIHDDENLFKFENVSERMYYRKLLHYYKDGIVDGKEEYAIEIMQKVFGLPIERLRTIESQIRNELGMYESQEYEHLLISYETLFAKLAEPLEVGVMERVSLQDYARKNRLRSTDILDIELKFWLNKAKLFSESGETSSLYKVLIQISLIDFQNPIIEELQNRHGISIADNEQISERNKVFEEYLSYIQIVYEDQKVTSDERRFLEIQRKRLRISEKEAYELEFLEKNLMGLLHKEPDDYYEMQCENFKLGGILLSQGIIDDKQLEHGLEIQSRDPAVKLGVILYDLGYVDHGELNRILELQKYLMFRKRSYFLGSMALKFAFIDRRQLKECLKLQELEFQSSKINRKLGDILLDQGYISQAALSFLISIQSLSKQV